MIFLQEDDSIVLRWVFRRNSLRRTAYAVLRSDGVRGLGQKGCVQGGVALAKPHQSCNQGQPLDLVLHDEQSSNHKGTGIKA